MLHRLTCGPFLASCIGLGLVSAQSVWALSVGDSAPKLSIVEWVKGDAVDLTKDSAKRIHLVEFWAVWCGPCKESVPLLTRLQAKYKDQLTIVGVTTPDPRGNTPSAIRRFVSDMGPNMGYTIAIDDRDQSFNAYMAAAGAVGIPHSFLVGKDGKIAWQGSPLDPSLETVIAGVVSGTYDPKIEKEVERRFRALEEPLGRQQWGVVADGLKEILKIAPANEMALRALRRAYTEESKKPEEFRSWCGTYMETNRNDAWAMVVLTGVLTEVENLSGRYPDLAVRAGRLAYESAQKRDLDILHTYANALYQAGAIEKAVAIQKEAVESSSGEEKKRAQAVLEFFLLCLQVQASTK